MNTLIAFVLGGMAMLVLSAFFFKHSWHYRFDEISLFGDDPSGLPGWDSLSLELGERIFSSEDPQFVALETSHDFRSGFRAERKALGLQWLRQIRREVNRLMRVHVKTARISSSLKATDELLLSLEYLFFQLSIAALFCAVWIYGPLAAAHLVKYCVSIAVELKRLEMMLPVRSVTAEILKSES